MSALLRILPKIWTSSLLGQGTWQELQAYRGEAKPLDVVFSSQKGRGHLSRVQVLKLVKDAAIRVGLSSDVSPHWMRHSHATHALERGASIILVKDTYTNGPLGQEGQNFPSETPARTMRATFLYKTGESLKAPDMSFLEGEK